jgi:hypothetical protein
VEWRASVGALGIQLPSLPLMMRSRRTEERAFAATHSYKSEADAFAGRETSVGRFLMGFPGAW